MKCRKILVILSLGLGFFFSFNFFLSNMANDFRALVYIHQSMFVFTCCHYNLKKEKPMSVYIHISIYVSTHTLYFIELKSDQILTQALRTS